MIQSFTYYLIDSKFYNYQNFLLDILFIKKYQLI